MQLRALASARNSQDAWDLRCEVREKLISFLQESYSAALPNSAPSCMASRALSAPRNSATIHAGQRTVAKLFRKFD
jgi:hypothetical protein